MRVCVVGNGPSANGTADLVDSCDVVVRCGEYWRVGSRTAGSKVDVWCTRREPTEYDPVVAVIWHHDCTWLGDGEVFQRERLGSDQPSNGYIAAMMARHKWPEAQIILVGFDAEEPLPGDPKSMDARGKPIAFRGHNYVQEKRILRERGLL